MSHQLNDETELSHSLSANKTLKFPGQPVRSTHPPPDIRPQMTDLTIDQAIQTIPFQKFQYNKHYAGQPAYVLVSCGSFSPVTVLHTQLLEKVRDYLMVDNKIGHVIAGLLSPVHDAYGKASLIHQDHRVAMCKLATDDFNWLGVTTIETSQKQWIETRLIFDLLQQAIQKQFQLSGLHCLIPNFKLMFCMGSDVFLGWSNPNWWTESDIELYCNKYSVAVLLREEDLDAVEHLVATHPIISKYSKVIHIIPPIFKNSISSTLIRNQLQSGGSIHGLVHPKVEQYIRKHKLYLGTVRPDDYIHSVSEYTALFQYVAQQPLGLLDENNLSTGVVHNYELVLNQAGIDQLSHIDNCSSTQPL